MADNHYVSCIAASYISFTNRPVKTGCVKTKLSAISSLGLGWKILQMFQPLRNPLLTGVPAEGFGHLIVSARLQMFQPVKVRCYEISKTLKTVSRPIIIRGRTRKKTTFPAQKEVRAWRKCLVVLQEHSMASGEVPVLQAGKKDKFVFKKGPFLLLKTSLSFF